MSSKYKVNDFIKSKKFHKDVNKLVNYLERYLHKSNKLANMCCIQRSSKLKNELSSYLQNFKKKVESNE